MIGLGTDFNIVCKLEYSDGDRKTVTFTTLEDLQGWWHSHTPLLADVQTYAMLNQEEGVIIVDDDLPTMTVKWVHEPTRSPEMKGTEYPGTNYALGSTSNLDIHTNIRYGIINANAQGLSEWLWESIEAEYDPYCPHCGNQLEDDWEDQEYETAHPLCPHCTSMINTDWGEQYGDEPSRQVINDADYEGIVDDHNDIIVFKSPYYTYAQFCSPCAPGACHLENPFSPQVPTPFDVGTPESRQVAADWLEEQGDELNAQALRGDPDAYQQQARERGFERCYCLGHDWFAEESAPYRVFSVETGKEVTK